jgi:mono/diheme cytochrome c family protein
VLDNYQNIMNTGKVKPGNPNGSDLYEVLTETDPDKRMPPPPASALSAEQIELIRKWIQQGAKNNSCDGCDTAAVTFSNHVLPTVKQFCQSCHGSTVQNGGVKLTTHAEVVSAVTTRNLVENINHAPGFKAMPPGAKLPKCEIRKVEIWVDAGMPNN